MGKKDYTFTFLTDYDVDFSEDESEENNFVYPPLFSSPPQEGLAPNNRFSGGSRKSKQKKLTKNKCQKKSLKKN